jgi:alpha-galactosidase
MMEITGDGGQLSGQLTTRWYGPMEMQNVRPAGEGLQFELRNLNDKDHPTRTWTARMGSDGSIRLVGDIWYAHVEQSGTRGTAASAERRRFARRADRLVRPGRTCISGRA